ncbi:O-antigen ligase family protein [Sphingomonas sp. MS122]|uniref:O-antigen ligase family protein n=1 Tax=Sphingomonas sp. MS122 TaxID=3412683 RepID=UPI003C2CA7B1
MLRNLDLRDPEVRAVFLRRLALFMGMMLTGGLFIFPRIPMLVGIVVLALVLKGPTLGIRRAMAPIFLLLVVVFAVTLIGGGGLPLGDVATRYANFAGGILLLGLYLDLPRSTMAGDLYFFGKIFSLQAVLTVILAETVNGLFRPVAFDQDLIYNTIGFIFTYHVMLEDSTRFLRPDGFFYEPAVLQIYLNIQLYIALFIFKNRTWGAAALLGVLATQSTTALIVSGGILAVYYVRLLPTATALEKLAGLIVAPVVAIFLTFVAVENFQAKFTGVSVGSTWAREYDAYTGLNVAAHYPLTGIGFGSEQYFQAAMKYGYFETQLNDTHVVNRSQANSNGIVMLLYMMGIPLALVFLFGLFRQRFFPHKLVFFFIAFTSLIPEPLALNPFFLMLIFSGLLHVPSRRLLPRFAPRYPAVPADGRLRGA